jgi:hypothetical protein
VLARYREREATPYAHAREIQQFYGYRDFTDPPEYFRLIRWLYTRTWLSDERPSVLFDLTTARLIERKLLLPGVSVLARLIACPRSGRHAPLAVIGRLLTDHQATLATLLTIENARMTVLEQLRRGAVGTSSVSMIRALKRVETIAPWYAGGGCLGHPTGAPRCPGALCGAEQRLHYHADAARSPYRHPLRVCTSHGDHGP